MSAPPLLVLGNVTHDRVTTATQIQEHAGGAVTFAARAAVRLGKQVAVVTAAPAKHPMLRGLVDDRLPLHLVRSRRITTFDLDYRTTPRTVRLLCRASMLTAADVPSAWRWAPAVYLGPVAGDFAPEIALGFPGFVIAGLQGWLRQFSPDGHLQAQAKGIPDLVHRLPAKVGLASLSIEDHPAALDLARGLAARGITSALTRGRAGAVLFAGSTHAGGAPSPIEIAAVPAHEVDPTGAGDVFALALGLALLAGQSLAAAGARAAETAARVVEGPGLGTL